MNGSIPEGAKVVFLLGGQGTQYFGMARTLFEQDIAFSEVMNDLDKLAVERYGTSVLEYIYDPSRDFNDRCDDLQLTFLGLFMVEYALARSLEEQGVRPDLLVGSSLGEFVAVAVAGHVPAAEWVAFLCDVADRIVDSMAPGGMVAVLAELEHFRAVAKPSADITFASINNSRHFVISADTVALERVRRQMDTNGILYQDLPVNFAFHSSMTDVLLARMRELSGHALNGFPQDAPLVYSSMSLAPITEVSPETCWRVMREPIRLTETVAALPSYQDHRYVDLSPSSTLASILRSSLPGTTTFPIITPFNAETENIDRLVGSLGVGK